MWQPIRSQRRWPFRGFAEMESDIAEGVRMCRESCRYFPFCGGGPPSNKHFENGSFASTETLFCKLHMKACLDVTADRLEQHSPAREVGVPERATTPRPSRRLPVRRGVKFHLNADWSSCLAIGAGVEKHDAHFFFRGPWRPPTSAELAAPRRGSRAGGDYARRVTTTRRSRGSTNATAARLTTVSACSSFLRLRDAWWKLVDESAESGGPVRGVRSLRRERDRLPEFQATGRFWFSSDGSAW